MDFMNGVHKCFISIGFPMVDVLCFELMYVCVQVPVIHVRVAVSSRHDNQLWFLRVPYSM